MRVHVLYFGVLKEIAERVEDACEVAEGSTAGELLTVLEREARSAVWRSVAVAVNREYASLATVLHDGDEVALLPPVSGGGHAG